MSRIQSDTKQTVSQGTITHMPPELIREGKMHQLADVWSYGVLLWEMYSGQRAWSGMSYTQLMQAIGYEKRGPLWPDDAPADLAVSSKAVIAVYYLDWLERITESMLDPYVHVFIEYCIRRCL